MAKRARSSRAQAGWPGARHHRGFTRHRPAARGGARTPALRHPGPSNRHDCQRQRHRRPAQGQWSRASASTQDRRLHPVPEFAAVVLRRRIADIPESARTRTVFASRNGGTLSPYNVRRTFRESPAMAELVHFSRCVTPPTAWSSAAANDAGLVLVRCPGPPHQSRRSTFTHGAI